MCALTIAASSDRHREFVFYFFITIKVVDLGRVPTRTNYLINQSSACGRRLGVIKYCLELGARELEKKNIKKNGEAMRCLLLTSNTNKKKKNRLPSPTFFILFECSNVV